MMEEIRVQHCGDKRYEVLYQWVVGFRNDN